MTNTCYVLFYPLHNLLGVLPPPGAPHSAVAHREKTCLPCRARPVPGKGRRDWIAAYLFCEAP